MNPFKSKHWFGIHAEPRKEDLSKPEKRTVLEEAGKCIETWSKVKRLGCNRVRWRCLKNTDTIADHVVSEVISAQVSESILCDKKENVCECC